MSDGFHGDEPMMAADAARETAERADFMADMRREDGTTERVATQVRSFEEYESEQRIKAALEHIHVLANELVNLPIAYLEVKKHFGLSFHEMETVIHRWTVAQPR